MRGRSCGRVVEWSCGRVVVWLCGCVVVWLCVLSVLSVFVCLCVGGDLGGDTVVQQLRGQQARHAPDVVVWGRGKGRGGRGEEERGDGAW